MSTLKELRALLGREGLLESGLDRYVTEPRGRFHGRPLAVARPASTEQVSQLVEFCSQHCLAIVPQGGHTGLVGGGSALNGELIISFERMRAIRNLDAVDASVVVEAGCPLGELRARVAEAGLLYPVSLASEGTATIGGTLATNAGGNLTLRYGNSRAQVLGLEVVLASGQVLSELSPLRKDNSGFDLKQCFIGSEGTLGLITAACLALKPQPAQSVTAMAACADLERGLALLKRLRAGLGETLSACEFMPERAMQFVLADQPAARHPFAQPSAWYVLFQVDSALAGHGLEPAVMAVLGEAHDQGLIDNAVVADSLARTDALWALREGISAAQKHGGVSLKHDISLPVARIPAFLDQVLAALAEAVPGIRPCPFGHLGDGNIHFNLSQPEGMSAEAFRVLEPECNRIVFERVRALGGSIAAEHGVGLLRRDELGRGQPLKVSLMQALKQAWDPQGLFNPGKVMAVAAADAGSDQASE